MTDMVVCDFCCVLSVSLPLLFLLYLTLGETSYDVMRNSGSQWKDPYGKNCGLQQTGSEELRPPVLSWKHICPELNSKMTAPARSLNSTS